MFLFLLFLHFHSCSSFFPVPHFCLLYLFSPFLWERTQNDPQRVDVSLNLNWISLIRVYTVCYGKCLKILNTKMSDKMAYANSADQDQTAPKEYIWLLYDYHNNTKYWDRQAWANSVDSDQMLQNVTSDQGVHCLLFTRQFLGTWPDRKP